MSLPERGSPSPDFIVMFKQQPLPPGMLPGRRAAFNYRMEETDKNIGILSQWLEERAFLNHVRFDKGNVFGAVPTFCSRAIAEILKDAPNVAVVLPTDIPMRIID